jgi:hypothetical protein
VQAVDVESCEFNDVLIAIRVQAYRWVLALSTRIARRLSVRLERVWDIDIPKSGDDNKRRSPGELINEPG